MQLWTDYEGLTIDGAYPLKRLLLPEGRSAFFSTANGKGEPLVLRLIECHFDQEEILARWRCLEAIDHPALLKLEHYGPIELDGGPVVYAVFENVDANLAEALDQGHLSAKETAQIAACVLSALEMLHSHGFVHEHVEARNVFAVGETVKFRSDCIREAREGEEGRQTKRRDAHDAAVLLLQALTQRASLEGVRETDLPAPFGEIIRNGLNGRWGVAEMLAALGPSQSERPQPKLVTPPPAPEKPGVKAAPEIAEGEARPAGPQLRLEFSPRREKKSSPWEENPVRSAVRQRIAPRLRREGSLLRSRWAAPVAAVVMLAVAALLFDHAWHVRSGGARPVHAAARHGARPASLKPGAAKPRAAEPVAQGNPPAQPASRASKDARTQWRVIVYTYDQKAAAQRMAATLATRHPGLQPQVFTPNGRAPYRVAIGGIMDRQQAYALAHRARALGLPHDSYARNF